MGNSLDDMCKVETGAKIETLVSIADLFKVSLVFLVCGCEKEAEIDSLLAGLNLREV